MRIVKSCPPCIWNLQCLLDLLYLSKPCLQLLECFRTVLEVLGPGCVRGETTKCNSHILAASDRPVQGMNVGKKRNISDESTYKRKRQKVGDDIQRGVYFSPEFADETDGKDAASLREMLISTVESLKRPPAEPSLLQTEISIVALSMLTKAFCFCPWTGIAHRLFHQMYDWIPWIVEQVTKNSPVPISY